MKDLIIVDCGFWKFETPSNSQRAKWGKEYEPVKVKFFEQNVKPGDVFVDVGACEGFFTLMAMQFTGREGHVVAFEPDRENFILLENNIRLNSHFFGLDHLDQEGQTMNTRIVTAKMAASNTGTVRPLFHGAKNGMHSVLKDLKDRSRITFEDVLTIELDRFPFQRPPTCMKIDVEGHELEVLDGAEKIMSSPLMRCVAVDVHPSLHNLGPLIISAVESKLKKAGFKIVYFKNQGNEVFGIKQ